MWQSVVAFALLAHGVGHVLFFGNAWGYWKTGDGRAALFAGLPQSVEGAIGLLWLVPLIAFMVATGAYVTTQTWWRPALMGAAAISLLMVILWWGSLATSSAFWAVAFDLAVVGILLWQRQGMLAPAS
jgi:hypothetical protein